MRYGELGWILEVEFVKFDPIHSIGLVMRGLNWLLD